MRKTVKERPKRRLNSQLLIVILLFIFCFLVIGLGINDLYDLVRHCITCILVVYLGWQGLSRKKPYESEQNDGEDNNEE